MRKTTTIWMLTLLLSFGVARAQQAVGSPMRLSLDECIRIALNDNPTIKVDSMEIKRVQYALKEVKGQLLPQVNATGQYTRNISLQTMYMDPGNGEVVGIKMGRDNTYAAGFTATLPLVAPQLWKTIKLNETQILQNIENARANKLSLVNQVKNAYYALLLAYDTKRVIEQNHSTAMEHAAIYQKQFQLGTASEYDVLRANVAVTNLEPSILEAENSVNLLKLQLKVLMGMDARLEIEPAQHLDDFKALMYDKTLRTDTSLVNNTTLKKLDLQTDLLKKTVDVRKAAWYPTLSATGNLMWHSMGNGSPFKNFRWTRASAVGLTLAWPVFTGFQRTNKIKQAQIQASEMTWQRENTLRSLHMQVQSQVDNIHKSIKQIESNTGGVAQAEKASDIMQKSFKVGAASFIQLRDTDDALMNARLSYYQAIYNYLVAESNLELVLGNTPYAN
ncbi:MAG: TolC family protein [Muribaculaceae bacterium]|nr:TolC family protein [Muribaculaceae bacterium]